MCATGRAIFGGGANGMTTLDPTLWGVPKELGEVAVAVATQQCHCCGLRIQSLGTHLQIRCQLLHVQGMQGWGPAQAVLLWSPHLAWVISGNW